MKRIDKLSIEMKKDLTEFHGLIRKLYWHGFKTEQIQEMTKACFPYGVIMNNMAERINKLHDEQLKKRLELDASLNEDVLSELEEL